MTHLVIEYYANAFQILCNLLHNRVFRIADRPSYRRRTDLAKPRRVLGCSYLYWCKLCLCSSLFHCSQSQDGWMEAGCCVLNQTHEQNRGTRLFTIPQSLANQNVKFILPASMTVQF